MIVFLNGHLLHAHQAMLQPSDRGFTLGDGLFETIKVTNGRPLRLEAHWNRLREGAHILRLVVPLDFHGLSEAISELLEANRLHEAALRLTVSRGAGLRGLLPPDPCCPTVLLTASPLPPLPGPAQAIIAQSTRRNAHSPLSRCKALSYLDNILARMEAQDRGADDALLLNTEGRLTESTIANLFIVTRHGDILTPPIRDGALPGTRRAELLHSLGATEHSLDLADLSSAAEAFLTNALSIRPLIGVDGRSIGHGIPGPLTRRLLDVMDQDQGPQRRPGS